MSQAKLDMPDAVQECPEVAIVKARRISRESGRSSVLARCGKRRPEEAWDAFDSMLSLPDGYRVKAWCLVDGSVRVIPA